MPNVSVPTAITHRDAILRRIEDGERLGTIAASLGVTASAISRQLTGDADYRLALQCGVAALLEQQEEELERSFDGATYARAKELLSHARWLAERLDPQTWGLQRQAVSVHANGPATIKIISWAEHDASA